MLFVGIPMDINQFWEQWSIEWLSKKDSFAAGQPYSDWSFLFVCLIIQQISGEKKKKKRVYPKHWIRQRLV